MRNLKYKFEGDYFLQRERGNVKRGYHIIKGKLRGTRIFLVGFLFPKKESNANNNIREIYYFLFFLEIRS